MNILTPFWNLDFFSRSSHRLQLTEISRQLKKEDNYDLIYMEGDPSPVSEYFQQHMIATPHSFLRSKTIRWYVSRNIILKQIRKLIEETDVSYTLSGFLVQEICRYYKERNSIPYVVRLRGNHRITREKAMANENAIKSFIKRKSLNYLETRSLKQADLVIPISREIASEVRRWGVPEDKIAEVVYNGVDTNLFRPIPKREEMEPFTVGYAGRMSPEKGINRLFKLFRRMPDIRFVLAGPKQMDIPLFPKNVKYYGVLSHSEMVFFYSQADLIVLPSHTEGFPNVLLEAYSCSKPVLVTPEVFPKDDLKIFGYVAPFSKWVKIIQDWKKNSSDRIGKQAREYVRKRFKWEIFGRKMVECLESVSK